MPRFALKPPPQPAVHLRPPIFVPSVFFVVNAFYSAAFKTQERLHSGPRTHHSALSTFLLAHYFVRRSCPLVSFVVSLCSTTKLGGKRSLLQPNTDKHQQNTKKHA